MDRLFSALVLVVAVGCGPDLVDGDRAAVEYGPVDVWVGEGFDVADAKDAIGWIGRMGGDCVTAFRGTWAHDETPPGVIVLEVDPGLKGKLAGRADFSKQGSGFAYLRPDKAGDVAAIAHELLHILLDAGNEAHAPEGPFSADGHTGYNWILPDWHRERLRSFCRARMGKVDEGARDGDSLNPQ